MQEFKIHIKDRIGELARVAEALARNGVNIKAIAGERNFVRVVTDDVNTTKRALDEERLKYDLEEVVVVSLIDRPGELAKVARKLTDAEIGINSVYILGKKDGKTDVALVVDSVSEAVKVLGI